MKKYISNKVPAMGSGVQSLQSDSLRYQRSREHRMTKDKTCLAKCVLYASVGTLKSLI